MCCRVIATGPTVFPDTLDCHSAGQAMTRLKLQWLVRTLPHKGGASGGTFFGRSGHSLQLRTEGGAVHRSVPPILKPGLFALWAPHAVRATTFALPDLEGRAIPVAKVPQGRSRGNSAHAHQNELPAAQPLVLRGEHDADTPDATSCKPPTSRPRRNPDAQPAASSRRTAPTRHAPYAVTASADALRAASRAQLR